MAAREPVGRALEVLEWVADHPSRPLSVRQLARDLGTTPSTIHRTFASLEEHRLLGRTEDGHYVVGLHLYQICESIAGGLSPTHIAMPHVERLAAECGETVSFGVYDARERRMMFSASVETSHELRLVPQLHRWMPVHAGATGLVILAHLPRAERQAVYADGLDQVTPATLTSPAEIEAALEGIRARGYAQSVGQRVVGAVGFAGPVFDAERNICGEVCVTLPEQRYTAGEFADSIVVSLKDACRRVTEAMAEARFLASRPTPRDAVHPVPRHGATPSRSGR